jgi:hypothetical protein
MKNLENFLEDIFLKKVPYQLPQKAKDIIVGFAYWAAIIGVVLSVLSILSFLRASSYFSTLSRVYGVSMGAQYYLGIVVLVIQTVLMGLSIPGLKVKSKKGWQMMYYSALVSVAYSVVSFYSISSLVWSLIWSAVGMYILFQVKSVYAGQTGQSS